MKIRYSVVIDSISLLIDSSEFSVGSILSLEQEKRKNREIRVNVFMFFLIITNNEG